MTSSSKKKSEMQENIEDDVSFPSRRLGTYSKRNSIRMQSVNCHSGFLVAPNFNEDCSNIVKDEVLTTLHLSIGKCLTLIESAREARIVDHAACNSRCFLRSTNTKLQKCKEQGWCELQHMYEPATSRLSIISLLSEWSVRWTKYAFTTLSG